MLTLFTENPIMSILSIARFISGVVKNFFFQPKVRLQNRSAFKSIYDFQFFDSEGKLIDLSSYRGKKLLIVNTASECRYTVQYDDLEALNTHFTDVINIVAFPCNDFGAQEKGSDQQINEFCRVNYGVTFKVMKKTRVKRAAPGEIFNWLCDPQLNGWNSHVPLWNFWKFLIDENGRLMAVVASKTKPNSSKMLQLINS